MSAVSLKNLSLQLGKKSLFKDFSFTVHEGERWVVLGKNGTGKSTLLKLISGLIKPRNGSISLGGTNIASLSIRERATMVAMVPQTLKAEIPFSLEHFLLMSTFSHHGVQSVSQRSEIDDFDTIISLCDIGSLLDQSVSTLSGGETQRALLASALLQKSPILLLDEPTASLDPFHKAHFFSILNQVLQSTKKTVIMVTHEINDALQWGSHVLGITSDTDYFTLPVKGFECSLTNTITRLYGLSVKKYFNEEQAYYVTESSHE